MYTDNILFTPRLAVQPLSMFGAVDLDIYHPMELNGVAAHGGGENSRFSELIYLGFTKRICTNPVNGREAAPDGVGVDGVGEFEVNQF